MCKLRYRGCPSSVHLLGLSSSAILSYSSAQLLQYVLLLPTKRLAGKKPTNATVCNTVSPKNPVLPIRNHMQPSKNEVKMQYRALGNPLAHTTANDVWQLATAKVITYRVEAGPSHLLLAGLLSALKMTADLAH